MNKSGETSLVLKIAVPSMFLILLAVLIRTIQNGMVWESLVLVLVEAFLLFFNFQIFKRK